MSSVSTKTCPSQSATPRFATMPKFRKTATLSGVQRHLTCAGRRVERPDVVVVRRHVQRAVRLDRDTTARRAGRSASICVEVDGERGGRAVSTLPVVICVSGEWRSSSGVLPKPPQPTLAPADGRAGRGREEHARRDRSDNDRDHGNRGTPRAHRTTIVRSETAAGQKNQPGRGERAPGRPSTGASGVCVRTVVR